MRAPEAPMPEGIHSAVLIYNPLAGTRRGWRLKDLLSAERILAEAGIRAEMQATSGPGAATELARRAVTEGRHLVVVCGGDGTINEAVNGLAGSRVPLAVLPAGTANVLAKELGLPWNIRAAAELIPRGKLRRVALGCARHADEATRKRFFLCVAGAGADAALVYSVRLAHKIRLGIVAYWLEGLRQLFRYPFPKFRVAAAGREAEAALLIVGRTAHYGGPFRITTGASLAENEFELAVFTSDSPLRYLTYLPAVWLGRLRNAGDVQFWKAASVSCEPLGEAPVRAQVDGEPIGRLPVEFTIVPDALTLVVPETSPLASAAAER